LHEARERERAGCIPEAIECYESAIAVAEQGEEQTVLAEALRRLAVLRHHGNESARARELCRRSLTVARSIGNDVLAAEALNTVGGLDLTTGSLDDARKSFLEALDVGGRRREPPQGRRLPGARDGVPRERPPVARGVAVTVGDRAVRRQRVGARRSRGVARAGPALPGDGP